MVRVNRFRDLGEAVEHIAEWIGEIGLEEQAMQRINEILRKIKPGLPALDYALRLLREEPALVTGKRELLLACDELYGEIAEIEALKCFEGCTVPRDSRYPARIAVAEACGYLYSVLSKAHRDLCILG